MEPCPNCEYPMRLVSSRVFKYDAMGRKIVTGHSMPMWKCDRCRGIVTDGPTLATIRDIQLNL